MTEKTLLSNRVFLPRNCPGEKRSSKDIRKPRPFEWGASETQMGCVSALFMLPGRQAQRQPEACPTCTGVWDPCGDRQPTVGARRQPRCELTAAAPARPWPCWDSAPVPRRPRRAERQGPKVLPAKIQAPKSAIRNKPFS